MRKRRELIFGRKETRAEQSDTSSEKKDKMENVEKPVEGKPAKKRKLQEDKTELLLNKITEAIRLVLESVKLDDHQEGKKI